MWSSEVVTVSELHIVYLLTEIGFIYGLAMQSVLTAAAACSQTGLSKPPYCMVYWRFLHFLCRLWSVTLPSSPSMLRAKVEWYFSTVFSAVLITMSHSWNYVLFFYLQLYKHNFWYITTNNKQYFLPGLNQPQVTFLPFQQRLLCTSRHVHKIVNQCIKRRA